MARRGFLAEIHRQAKQAAREREKAEREAERSYQDSLREEEKARKAEERAAAQLAKAEAKADAKARKAAEKAAKEAHVKSMEAEVERKNAELAGIYDEIDSLLAATLEVDDYVDLDKLRPVVEHPPFDRTDLESPLPPPHPIPTPPEPKFIRPEPNLFQRLFGKSQYLRKVADAEAAHQRAIDQWKSAVAATESERQRAAKERDEAEAKRALELQAERTRYKQECEARESEANEQNQAIDALIANLGYGAADAVDEYVSIVLSNSVYPPHFPVEHEFSFDPPTAELKLLALVPGPDTIPKTKAFKYTKASDEIGTTDLSQKACRDRYASAVHQVALRSIHEIFEADRRGIVKTISLEVATKTIVPATGLDTYVPFVAVAAERDAFLALNLANVEPAATLKHMGAAVSKNPFGLVAVEGSGVRRS